MKTHRIELQRLKAATHDHGEIELQVDALVSSASASRDDQEPATTVRLSEETARVLMALLKVQLMELDKRKARSQR
jgi:hypothetical protein